MTRPLEGVVPVLPTPFRPADESVDLDAVGDLVRFAAGLDIAAVCLPAYPGEFYKLDESERTAVIRAAVEAAGGRVPVIAQSNHPAARVAAEIARRNADLGANLISFAIPRLFALTTADLLDYCATICQAVELPVLIQDFNPGGPTIDANFCARLLERCANFRYVKLEEPLMGAKVLAIREATHDQIGVLEGWGGMYMLELIPCGICGLMPGLGAADLLARTWRLAQSGDLDGAMAVFERVLPQVAFSLQNMELYLHLEKQLLVQRGVLASAIVRRPAYTPDATVLAYGELLNTRLVRAIDELVRQVA